MKFEEVLRGECPIASAMKFEDPMDHVRDHFEGLGLNPRKVSDWLNTETPDKMLGELYEMVLILCRTSLLSLIHNDGPRLHLRIPYMEDNLEYNYYFDYSFDMTDPISFATAVYKLTNEKELERWKRKHDKCQRRLSFYERDLPQTYSEDYGWNYRKKNNSKYAFAMCYLREGHDGPCQSDIDEPLQWTEQHCWEGYYVGDIFFKTHTYQ